MTYDFELMFGGLCLFTFEATNDPQKPAKAKVLLANATSPKSVFDSLPLGQAPHLHIPRLTVSAKNLKESGTGRDRLPDKSFAGPDGEDYAVFDVDLEELKLLAPGAPNLYRPLGRRAGAYKYPSQSGANPRWFDWICGIDGSSISDPRISGLNNASKQPPVKSGPHIASLEFTVGELRTFDVSRAKGETVSVNFEAVDEEGEPPTQPGHCIADRICLHILDRTDEQVVQFKSSAGLITVGPESSNQRSTVKAALTNLHEDYHVPDRRVYDFLWYYEMFDWNVSPPRVEKRLIPVVAESEYFTPSSGLCPPASSG